MIVARHSQAAGHSVKEADVRRFFLLRVSLISIWIYCMEVLAHIGLINQEESVNERVTDLSVFLNFCTVSLLFHSKKKTHTQN